MASNSSANVTFSKAASGFRFETCPDRRLEARLYVIFLLATTIPIVFFLSLIAMAVGSDMPILPALAIASLASALTLWGLMGLVLSKLRFCVIFHQDCLQFGQGLAQIIFPYRDVEIIYIMSEPILKVRCGKKTASVWLTPHDLVRCIGRVQGCCPNAVIVDRTMQAHLPKHCTQPEKALDAIERHYYRITLLRSIGVCYFGLIFALLTWGLMQWHGGNVLLIIILEDVLIKFLIGFCIITLIGLAWRSWRTARDIKGKRNKSAIWQEVPQDGDDTSAV